MLYLERQMRDAVSGAVALVENKDTKVCQKRMTWSLIIPKSDSRNIGECRIVMEQDE